VLGEDQFLLAFVGLREFSPQEHLQVLGGVVRLQLCVDALGEGDAAGVDLVLDLAQQREGGLEGERLRGARAARGEVVDQEVAGCEAAPEEEVFLQVVGWLARHVDIYQ